MPVKASRVKKNIYKLLLSSLFIIALCVFAVFLISCGCSFFTADNGVYAAETVETADDYADIVPAGKAELLFGNEALPDKDAYVITIYGDGFMAHQQDKFFEAARNSVEYFIKEKPFDELASIIKIYAIGVVSNTDRIQGANGDDYTEITDTYFHTRFGVNWIDRLMACNSEGSARLTKLQNVFCPYSDQALILSNSEKYGGGGGGIAVISLSSSAIKVFVHEFGHSAAKLGDEYWEDGYAYECANKTKESDPEKVRWKRFIGLNGIGVYKFKDQIVSGDVPQYYKPSEICMMYAIAQPFCEVCKEELRKWLCRKSNVTMLFFQKYADEIRVSSQGGKDMSEYFIFRKGNAEVTGDKIDSGLSLSYYSSDGQTLDGAPNTPGTYKVKAVFTGNETFEACEQEGVYEVLPPKPLMADSKVYDGKPAYVKYTPDNAEGYTHIDYTYTGKIMYSDTVTEDYNSSVAPILPGKYSVRAEAIGSAGVLQTDTADFSISLREDVIIDNRGDSLPWQQEQYRARNIMFAGDGFTAEEQDELEKLARRAAKVFRTTQPYAEFRNYISFSYTNTVSKYSGLGARENDAYFGLTCDASGKIVGSDRALALSGFLQEKYFGELITMAGNSSPGGRDEYSVCIVFVNDDRAKTGARATDAKGTRLTLYVPASEQGIEYAVRELANMIIGKQQGYAPIGEAQTAEYVKDFRKSFFYRYGSSYVPLIADGYNESFLYTGSPIDLSDYFHMYIDGVQLDADATKQYYSFTYYDDDRGRPGQRLIGAPSAVGAYYACVKLVPTREGYSMDVYDPVYKITAYLMTVTAFTRYRIVNAGDTAVDSNIDYIDIGGSGLGDNTCDHTAAAVRTAAKAATCAEDGNIEYWRCASCGKYFEDAQCTRQTTMSQIRIAAKGHDYTGSLMSDAHGHWHVCLNGCGTHDAKVDHTAGDWIYVKRPTYEEAGRRYKVCAVCDRELVFEELAPLDKEKVKAELNVVLGNDGLPVVSVSLPQGIDYELVYFDAGGVRLDGMPTAAGTYKVVLVVTSEGYETEDVTQATFTISQSNEPAAGQPEDNGGKINKTALISTVSVIAAVAIIAVSIVLYKKLKRS